MVSLYIFTGLFALLALALLAPLRLSVHYKDADGLHYRVRYLFFTLLDSEEPAQPAQKAPAKKPRPASSSGGAAGSLLSFLGLEELSSGARFREALAREGLLQTLGGIASSLRELLGLLLRLAKRGRFRRFRLRVTVGGDDPAQAAGQYGALCATIYPLAACLLSPRRQDILLRCDYDAAQTQVSFDGQLNYRPVSFVCFLFSLFGRYISRSLRKSRKDIV